jgi:tetratricopeptide (TPR) repeat protein
MPELLENRADSCRRAANERRAGRIVAALELLRKLEERHPPFGGLFEETGFCLLHAAQTEKALLAFQRAVELNPCLLESWRTLARLHEASARQSEARHAADQARQLAGLPEEIRTACANFYDGESAAAEELVRGYLATKGEHVEALRLLAKIANDAGALHDAELLLQRALAHAPGHEAARHELALVLLKRHKHRESLEYATQLLAVAPDSQPYRRLYAEATAGMGDYNRALPIFGELLRESPRDSQLYLAVGEALKTTGETGQAAAAYQLATASSAGFGAAFWGLANLKTYRFTPIEIERMMRAQMSSSTGSDDRYHLCFALGKALEDAGRFAQAFEYYARGNELKKATAPYRPQALEAITQRQMAFCTREFFASRAGFGVDSRAPIFIVGLPRSGSTLIEQILASHSQVDGTMELAHIPRLALELRQSERAAQVGYPQILGELTARMCDTFGSGYLRDTAPYRAGKPRFTDKMPNNFQHLDLVQLTLPNARVLDIRREPMACCFAIFKQLFANGHHFAYNLADIARYYRLYVDLMAHWERILPGKILRVQYEDVVTDLDSNVRRILEFCGLDFEPACLEFHRTRRNVHTPSAAQVQQPLYREAIDQWRNFEPWLAPLRQALGL